MKTLVVLAALAASVPAFSQASLPPSADDFSDFYTTPIGPDPAFPDDMNVLEDCQYTVAIKDADDMAEGSICGRAVAEWLIDTNRWKHEFSQVLCGAKLILADSDPKKSVADILAPSFDSACGEPPATM